MKNWTRRIPDRTQSSNSDPKKGREGTLSNIKTSRGRLPGGAATAIFSFLCFNGNGLSRAHLFKAMHVKKLHKVSM